MTYSDDAPFTPFKRTGARECDRSANGLADYLAATTRPYGHVTDDQYLEEAIAHWSHLNEDEIEYAIARAANIAEARTVTLREQLQWRREMLDEMCWQASSHANRPTKAFPGMNVVKLHPDPTAGGD
jgi:hypothetical protein